MLLYKNGTQTFAKGMEEAGEAKQSRKSSQRMAIDWHWAKTSNDTTTTTTTTTVTTTATIVFSSSSSVRALRSSPSLFALLGVAVRPLCVACREDADGRLGGSTTSCQCGDNKVAKAACLCWLNIYWNGPRFFRDCVLVGGICTCVRVCLSVSVLVKRLCGAIEAINWWPRPENGARQSRKIYGLTQGAMPRLP